MTTLRTIADKIREADETGAAGYEDLARVAVAAMREPGDDAVDVGAANVPLAPPDALIPAYRDEALIVYQSMIDHILNET